jgi:ABC-2 type transport system permease protein
MSSNIDTPAVAAPVPAVHRSQARLFETMVTLVRREFWEHRGLWLAPLATAAVLVMFALFAHGRVMHITLEDEDVGSNWGMHQALALSTYMQAVVWVLLSVVMVFVLTFYFADCLYAERKDRSIYFWKSLPVSDGLTVASKVLVGTLLVPLGVWLLAALTHIVIMIIFATHSAIGQLPHGIVAWNTLTWLRVEALFFLGVLLAALWNAPITGFLVLVSAWARRNPLMWAMVPLLLALLEFILFRSTYLWTFIAYRMGGIWDVLANRGDLQFIHASRHHMVPLDTLWGDLNFRAAFTYLDLWLGVAAAAGLVYAATRIRRFRDDT